MAETEAILLRRFVRSGDAEAFAEIIRRYAGLVYSAALRVLADVDRASDVAQDTFLQLAKDAGNVTGSLPGWLHRVATHKAIDQVRRDATRKHREAQYMAARPHEEADWRDISPYVDEGLNLLEPQLRNILISHFLEGRSTREIARVQGLSQATISRRIEAGVEQLRAGLRRRGILVAAAALGVLLADNAVHAAPQALLTELGKIALISGSLAASTAATGTASGLGGFTASVLTAAKTNAVVVATAAVVLVGAGSAIVYYQLARPARQTPSSVSLAAQDAAGPTSVFDPPDVAVSGAGAGAPPATQVTGAAGSADEAVRQTPALVFRGIPGPEAETDPRDYVPSGMQGSVTTALAVSALGQDEAPDRVPTVAGVNSNQTPPEPVPEEIAGQAVSQTRESPYETVMRLRRGTTGTIDEPAGPDVSTLIPVGPVMARVELRLAPPSRGSPCALVGCQRQDTTTVKPTGVQETPPDAPSEPVYFVVRAGDRQIQGVTYRATRPRGNVLLLLDTDGDGLWSDERAYVGRRLSVFQMTATYEFGPVYLRQGRTQPGGEAFYVQCSDGKWLTFWPAFYRDGNVVLEGKSYRIALVDTDFDGRFNGSLIPPAASGRDRRCDVLAIDLNGDGEFIGKPSEEQEIMPLDKVIRIGGQCYCLDVTEDGSAIEFRRAGPVAPDLGADSSRP